MAYITKRANGWRAQVERQGVRQSMVHPTKAAAQQWAAALEAELLAKKRGQLPRKTVLQALDRYGAEVSPRKKGDAWEQKRLAAFRREPWAAKLLADLAAEDLAAWRDRRLLGVTGGTVLRDVNLLRAVFNVARKEWGWLDANPFDGVELPPDNKPRIRRVTPPEVRAICRRLGYVTGKVRTKKQQVALAFLISLRTGMRSGEILSLTPEDVDLTARVATLVDTKNGDARRVPLGRAARRLFASWSGWTVAPASRDTLFRAARKAAGISGMTFHDSRAEALTRFSSKLNVLELARVSGHKDLKILMERYYRETAEQIALKL
jgi:integrase